MNITETLALLKALKLSGATHFKSQDFEVSLETGSPKGLAAWLPDSQTASAVSAPIETASAVPQNDVATEKLKDLIETLKMDDATLLDKIFPAGAGG